MLNSFNVLLFYVILGYKLSENREISVTQNILKVVPSGNYTLLN